MQVAQAGAAPYSSPIGALSTIAREEGVTRGLYRGLALNYLKAAPSVAIYLTLYDFVKNSVRT
jgi:hypothetical protein